MLAQAGICLGAIQRASSTARWLRPPPEKPAETKSRLARNFQ
jgi:hypothetical protein